MNKEKVLLTGVSGFLGCELAHKCVENGYEVAGLVRQHPKLNEAVESLRGKITLYEGDLCDPVRMNNIVREYNPEYICHLGALTRVSYSFGHVIETMRTNLEGTVNLVTAAENNGSNLKRFIYASSMETYGDQPYYQKKMIPVDENVPQNAGSPYAVWKIASETYLKQRFYANKFPCICLRQTNTYGRHFDDYFVVEAFVTAMLKNKNIVNFGNPKPIRNFLYVNDLIDLYITLLKNGNKKLNGHSFCTGPSNGITIAELAEMIARKLDWHGKINWYTREIRDGEIFYLNSTNKKVTSMTDWEPKTTLSKGLDKTILFWKEKLCKN
jgi:nucleoside-diphosphate-sugar epimerase